MLQNYLDIIFGMKRNKWYPFFIFVYITWRHMKNISCFPDQGCYKLVNQTLNSTDLDLGNPELGNETR